ncbi:MAG: hypothetical protein HC905_21900 [Bacteroidales bacterium]|nr:hypothetical protein [Bacteroidales bacterium]
MNLKSSVFKVIVSTIVIMSACSDKKVSENTSNVADMHSKNYIDSISFGSISEGYILVSSTSEVEVLERLITNSGEGFKTAYNSMTLDLSQFADNNYKSASSDFWLSALDNDSISDVAENYVYNLINLFETYDFEIKHPDLNPDDTAVYMKNFKADCFIEINKLKNGVISSNDLTAHEKDLVYGVLVSIEENLDGFCDMC